MDRLGDNDPQLVCHYVCRNFFLLVISSAETLNKVFVGKSVTAGVQFKKAFKTKRQMRDGLFEE